MKHIGMNWGAFWAGVRSMWPWIAVTYLTVAVIVNVIALVATQ